LTASIVTPQGAVAAVDVQVVDVGAEGFADSQEDDSLAVELRGGLLMDHMVRR
jgi:hypothetical protein